MFKKFTLSAAAAVAAIAAIPTAADAELFGGGDQARQVSQRNTGTGRTDVRRQDQRSCRSSGGVGTLLGAIAGGLLGRPAAGNPGGRAGARSGRDCR